MDIIFEKFERKHAQEIADILNYYIKNTTYAYRDEIVGKDFPLRFLESSGVFCSFVIKNKDTIIGFCVLEAHSVLPAFSKAAEVLYFIHHNYTRKGAGSLALKKIEDEAGKIGITKLLADISTENTESIIFHKNKGFTEYGRLPDIGEKFGRKFGLVYLVKDLE